MTEVLQLATEAALTAGKLILSLQGKAEVRYKGSSYNLVTKADKESENAIVSMIRSSMPDSIVMSEETLWQQNIMAERLWIIDPLDGTNNFAHSIPHYCVSIAYAEKGSVKAGVIYDPNRDEMFTAESGMGAFCNGEKISVSQSKSLKESVIATGFYYERGEMMQNTLFSIFQLLNENIQGIRRMGSAALDLSWVACGRYEGYFEYMLSPWDFAAGMLLIKEAGGVFTDRDGNDVGLCSQGVVCSNKYLYKEFLKKVKWSPVNNEKQLVLR